MCFDAKVQFKQKIQKFFFNKKSLKISGRSDLLLVQLQWPLQLRDWSELQPEPGQPVRDPFSNLKRLSNKIVDVKQVRYSFRKSYEGPLNNVKWSKRPLYWNPLLKIHNKIPTLDDKLFQKRNFIEKYFVIHRNIFTKDLQQYSLDSSWSNLDNKKYRFICSLGCEYHFCYTLISSPSPNPKSKTFNLGPIWRSSFSIEWKC